MVMTINHCKVVVVVVVLVVVAVIVSFIVGAAVVVCGCDDGDPLHVCLGTVLMGSRGSMKGSKDAQRICDEWSRPAARDRATQQLGAAAGFEWQSCKAGSFVEGTGRSTH